MTEQEILSNLCYYDKRNPDYDAENGEKPKDCYCESCFRGQTKMAEYILELKSQIEKLKSQIK